MSVARALAFAGIAVLGLLVQGACELVTPAPWPVPEWCLCVVLYLALSRRGTLPSTVILALVVGYFTDLVSGAPKGLHALTFSAVVVAAGALAQQLMVTASVQVLVVALAAALVHGWLVVFALSWVSGPGASAEGWLLPAVPVAIATALLAVPVFRLCRRLDRRFQGERSALRAGW